MKIYRDPAVEGAAGGEITPPVEVKKYTPENQPKSKEEWQQLSKDDPQTWMSLTQSNTDKMYRENKELQERLDRERQEKDNLTLELNKQRQPPPVNPDGSQQYSTNNFPKTEAEWEALAIEKPIFAMDLRNAYNNRQATIATDFNRAFSSAAQEVQGEHPDMYVQEVDANGQVLKDPQGKPILKKGANGLVIPNTASDKWKIWEQIYNESAGPGGNMLNGNPNAPRLMMAELERRLVKKGQQMIQSTEVRQNQVVAPGVPPPISTKATFKSKEEEAHAQLAVERGIYTSKEQYCQLRDGENSGYYEESRRPDFSKK